MLNQPHLIKSMMLFLVQHLELSPDGRGSQYEDAWSNDAGNTVSVGAEKESSGSRVKILDAVEEGEHDVRDDHDHGTHDAGSGRDEVPLSVLLLVSFLDSFVILRHGGEVFVKEKVAVDDTEVVEHQ